MKKSAAEAWRIEKRLTPPTLLERRCYDSYALGIADQTVVRDSQATGKDDACIRESYTGRYRAPVSYACAA